MFHIRKWLREYLLRASSNLAGQAPQLCLALVIVAIGLQYLFIRRLDPDRCNSLLNHGSWPPNDTLAETRREFERWEPAGCRMHEYSRDEFRDCLGGRRLVFAGDSVTRQVFWAAVRRLDHVKADELIMETFVSENPQHDISLEVESVKLQFLWDPWLNSSILLEELSRFQSKDLPILSSDGTEASAGSAALLLMGAPGLWSARNGGEDYFPVFKRSIDGVTPYLRNAVSSSHGRKLSYNDISNQVLLAPVHIPAYNKLSSSRKHSLSPEKIQTMNRYLDHLPSVARSHLAMVYNEMTRHAQNAYMENGIHMHEGFTERWIDAALNVRCNAGLVWHGQLNQITCCAGYPSLLGGQAILALLGVIIFSVAVSATGISTSLSLRFQSPLALKLRALLTIVLVAAYCFLADRTQLFAKAEKHYAHGTLLGLLALGHLLAALSVQSAFTENEETNRITTDNPRQSVRLLPQHIANEWQGWMHITLLLLRFQNTNEVLWAYALTRLCISSFVFITAYNHARYFIETDDLSFGRFCVVIFRLNALSCLLGLVMAVSWTTYHLTYLLSFWFVLTYVGFRILRRANQTPRFLHSKLFLVALATLYLAHDPRFMTYIGHALQKMAPIVYDQELIRKQLALDTFPGLAGLWAACYAQGSTISESTVNGHARYPPQASSGEKRSLMDQPLNHVGPTLPWQNILRIFSALSLVVFLWSYIRPECNTREDYDRLHLRFAAPVVLSFAVLRTSHRTLRHVYFAVPAFLGRFAVESYVLHRHILLSGDGTGLLRIGLWTESEGIVSALGWRLETVVLTILLLWASHKAHCGLRDCASWLFGDGLDAGLTPGGIEMDQLESGTRNSGHQVRPCGASSTNKLPRESSSRWWRQSYPFANALALVALLWLFNYANQEA